MLAGLGAMATAGALRAGTVEAQNTTAVPAPFAPTLHAEDAWLSALPGKHRVVLDCTSPGGVPDAIRFAGNLLIGHKSGYGVEESDIAIVVCFRHGATPYGFTDVVWSKYGKTIDTNAMPPVEANPVNSGSRMQLADLATRGVHFMVCRQASRGLAGRIAGPGGDGDAVLKELGANLVASARLVAAGVIGVTHAQERGYALLFVG